MPKTDKSTNLACLKLGGESREEKRKFQTGFSPEKFKISKRRLKFLKLHAHFDRICFDRFNINLSLR